VIGLLVGLGIVVTVILGLFGLFTWAGGAVLLGLVLIVSALGIAIFVALIGATAEGVLRAALYRYATTGTRPPATSTRTFCPSDIERCAVPSKAAASAAFAQ
jgi:hypothetical protein